MRFSRERPVGQDSQGIWDMVIFHSMQCYSWWVSHPHSLLSIIHLKLRFHHFSTLSKEGLVMDMQKTKHSVRKQCLPSLALAAVLPFTVVAADSTNNGTRARRIDRIVASLRLSSLLVHTLALQDSIRPR